ncbi:polysaccharide deacetylase family protein [Variovorax paradoxus]|uniref:polysaccharide deacetylase family protein n=1 Tax=Variovorax paradoxus TaxID=34073 RepID=UPI0029C878DB|nr:polysaccharide deacetylase family protein [Variovorax paradoxus]WPH18121.1 polysaccharide deacetylase family protein [Variovorax paradoxus]WPH18130.1 polysaccharide deacetylase family protein [Variovorax paradoxus]
MKKFDTKLDRYPFSAIVDRPSYRWPNGAGLAVYFALNIEAFEFGRNPGNDFTSMPSAPFHRGYAYRDYGNRVGVWRIKQLFDDLGFPLAVLANSSVYDVYPRVLQAFRERGDEFVGHGRTNSERQIDMDESTERTMISEVAERMRTEEGRAPGGWLGPFISQSPRTPELLKDLGFSYMLDWFFDDQPTWFRTDKGQILAVPYPSMELNDLPAYVNRGASDSDFTRMMMDAFDEQLEEASRYPTVYCVSLHTFLTGQPQRIRQLRTVLQHIATHRDEIWFTTPGAIAEHVAQLPVGTVPGDIRS